MAQVNKDKIKKPNQTIRQMTTFNRSDNETQCSLLFSLNRNRINERKTKAYLVVSKGQPSIGQCERIEQLASRFAHVRIACVYCESVLKRVQIERVNAIPTVHAQNVGVRFQIEYFLVEYELVQQIATQRVNNANFVLMLIQHVVQIVCQRSLWCYENRMTEIVRRVAAITQIDQIVGNNRTVQSHFANSDENFAFHF